MFGSFFIKSVKIYNLLERKHNASYTMETVLNGWFVDKRVVGKQGGNILFLSKKKITDFYFQNFKTKKPVVNDRFFAERGGFEPPVPFRVRQFSKLVD